MADYKACVWDLDGTLLYTLPTVQHYANRSLRHFGFHEITEVQCRDLCRYSISEFYKQLLKLGGCPREKIELLHDAVRDYDCSSYLQDSAYLTQPYEGICQVLDQLRSRGIRQAVLTNKPHNIASFLIGHFFAEKMDICIGQTPTSISKPDSHCLDGLLQQMKLRKEDILYIGDTDVDMKTGCNVGIATAAACWGYQPKEVLLRYSPEVVLDHPTDLLKIF